MAKHIFIHGAREHNLKNIHVALPIDKLTVITGVSGSGKSSLAFDTLYAEGQRRYVESLSAYARQFLGVMNKPDVDNIQGLSPAIAIEQKSVSKNPRSTVGTVTEIFDYLRLLFARIGIPHCPSCGKEITKKDAGAIGRLLLNEQEGTKLSIAAPVVRGRKGTHEQTIADLVKQGFSRMRIDGKIIDLTLQPAPSLDKNKKHTIEVLIDRVILRKKTEASRLISAIETAFELSGGWVTVIVEKNHRQKNRVYSRQNTCVDCDISLEELQPRMFSFNSPYGACETCHGLGISQKFSEEKIIPDENLSLLDGAIRPWQNHIDSWRKHQLQDLAHCYRFSLHIPWKKLPQKIRNIVLYGDDDFEGVIPQLTRLYTHTDSQYRRDELAKYLYSGLCESCGGKRLKPESLSVTISGKNIWEITEIPLGSLFEWFSSLKLSKAEQVVAQGVLREIINRLRFLIDVGLDYITLSREAKTLSGGEAQRIRLATQIGSELRGVLYVLDEPSIGLHQRDNQRLIATLKKLRDLGNTVVIVEHDEETICNADYVIELGPGAGVHGGEVVFQGTPAQLKKSSVSLTGQYLSGEKSIPVPEKRRQAFQFLEIFGASEHNLKNIDVKIPLGVFVCVTGVSGSGKSTLVNDVLYKALHKIFWATDEKPGRHRSISGYGNIDQVIIVDQSPIGRTPRSNPATYSGVFTPIRELFAATPEARARGYRPGRFSFNVEGGRCEECEGDGVKKIEMHFLPDIYVECERCKGKRYNDETLTIQYKGKNIAEVLDMTVEEALIFFQPIPRIFHKLKTLDDVGLGYIKLGQSATTLSGGEAQRIKLTSELSRKGTRNLYILDEPTTGLHIDDVRKLLNVIDQLVERGNTVLVIEHHLDVIKCADWVIDLGLEGGERGGRVVAEGTPERIARSARWSYTGKFLRQVLQKK